MATVKRTAKQTRAMILLNVGMIVFSIPMVLLLRWLAASVYSPTVSPPTQPVTAAPRSSAHPQVTLNSSAPYHKVVIPFRLLQNQIIASVRLNKQAASCLIDTGSRDIEWAELKLTGIESPHTYSMIQGGQVKTAKGIYLKSVELGALTLNNAYSIRMHTRQPQSVFVAIGNYAFQKLVLTIDYQRQSLILRDASYDITRLSLASRDALVDIAYEPGFAAYSAFGPARIFVKMQIEGQPALMFVDTGHYGGILLSPEFRRRLAHLPADQRLPPPFMGIGNTVIIAQTARPLHWKLSNLSGQTSGGVVDRRMIPEADALMGNEVLKDYRVTIDYTRKKMLLEYIGSHSRQAPVKASHFKP